MLVTRRNFLLGTIATLASMSIEPAQAEPISKVKISASPLNPMHLITNAFVGSQPLTYALYQHPVNKQLIIASGGIGTVNQVQFFTADGKHLSSVTLGDEQIAGEGVKMMVYAPTAHALIAVFGEHVFKIDAITHEAKKIGVVGKTPGSTAYGLTLCDDGKVRCGVYPTATVTTIDPTTEQIVFGEGNVQGNLYIRSVAKLGNDIYITTGSVKPSIKVYPNGNLDLSPSDAFSPPNIAANGFIDLLRPIGDKVLLIAYTDISGNTIFGFYNVVNKSWVKADTRIFGNAFTRIDENNVLISDGVKLKSLNMETGKSEEIMSTSRPYVSMFTLDPFSNNVPENSSTLSAISVANGTRYFTQYDLLNKRIIKDVELKHEPSSFINQSLVASDKTGTLYVGGHQGTGATSIDIDTWARTTTPPSVTGQAEDFYEAEDGRVYFGVYPNSVIFSATAKTFEAPRRLSTMSVPYKQSRPHAILVLGEKVIVGSVSDYGLRGGALTVMNKVGKVEYSIAPIANQSVEGLSKLDDSLIVGTTSVKGGLGISPDSKPAHVFLFDVNQQKVVWSTPIAGEGGLKSPIILDDKIYVSAQNGIAVLSRSGELLDYIKILDQKYTPLYFNSMMDYSPIHDVFVWVNTNTGDAYVVNKTGTAATKITDKSYLLAIHKPTGRVFIADKKTTIREYDISEVAKTTKIELPEYTVDPKFVNYYYSTGGAEKYGYPVSAIKSTANGGYRQDFSKQFVLYCTSKSKCFAVNLTSPIGKVYLNSGAETGRFGYPVTQELNRSGYKVQDYKSDTGFNSIFWNLSTGSTGVVSASGAIGRYFYSSGGVNKFGIPLGEEIVDGSGAAQKFWKPQGVVSIRWDAATGGIAVVDAK